MIIVILVSLLAVAAWWGAATDPRVLGILAPIAGLGIFQVVRAGPRLRKLRLPIICLALLLAYVFVQIVNASHVYDVIGGGLEPRPHVAWLPHSVNASSSAVALAWFAVYAAAFWLGRSLAKGDEALLACLAMHGALLAVAAMLMRPLDGSIRRPMGPFINENNFAAYMNVLMPVILGFGLALCARWRSRRSHPAYLLFFSAACMAAAVVISESRAGMGIGALVLLLWLACEWRAGRGRQRLAMAIPVLLVAGLVLLGGLEPIAKQIQLSDRGRLAHTLEQRQLALSGAGRLWRSNLFYGTGAGTFHCAFPYYQPQKLDGFYRHAHCDWLQVPGELGLVGLVLLVAAVGTALASACGSGGARARDPVTRGIAIGLAGLGLHACVDFPLQIPAITLLAAALTGVMAGRSGLVPCAILKNEVAALARPVFARRAGLAREAPTGRKPSPRVDAPIDHSL